MFRFSQTSTGHDLYSVVFMEIIISSYLLTQKDENIYEFFCCTWCIPIQIHKMKYKNGSDNNSAFFNVVEWDSKDKVKSTKLKSHSSYHTKLQMWLLDSITLQKVKGSRAQVLLSMLLQTAQDHYSPCALGRQMLVLK